MSQLLKFTGGLAAVGMGLASHSVTSATDGAASAYQLMSESEIAAHTATMQVLQGAAREEYRDAQYERLKQRALEHGFLMPDAPPWRSQSTAAATGGQTSAAGATEPDAAVAAAERHAAMRNKLEARREAAQQAEGVEPAKVQTGSDAVPQTVGDRTPVESAASQQHAGQVTTAGESDGKTPQASATGAQQTSAIDVGRADIKAEAQNMSDAPPSGPGASGASSENAAAEAAASGPASIEAVTAVHAPTPPSPPEPPSPPPAYQPGSVSGLGAQAGLTPGAVPLAAVGMENAGADAMNAYRDAMRERFDKYMQERQVQLDENMRRQREQYQAAMERNRTDAQLYPAQPYAYPPVPAYGPRYPAAFPGYRTPYWQQR